MAFSEYHADRVKRLLQNANVTEEKKMMGGLIFMVNHKMCIGLDMDKDTGLDRLMVRVGKLPYEELLGEKASRQMDFTGKAMRGFLFIDPEGFDLDGDLEFWVGRALEFNKILTAK